MALLASFQPDPETPCGGLGNGERGDLEAELSFSKPTKVVGTLGDASWPQEQCRVGIKLCYTFALFGRRIDSYIHVCMYMYMYVHVCM